MGSKTKLFVSHASEDKAIIADELAAALSNDYEVWYDKYKLTIGDSLLRKINEGLVEADYGVVILSKSFFSKEWPQAELDGLFSLETSNRKVILPIWHEISKEDVLSYSPILAGRLGIKTSEGIDSIVDAITAAVNASAVTASFDQTKARKARLASIEEDIVSKHHNEVTLKTDKGVQIVWQSVFSCVDQLHDLIHTTAEDSEILKPKILGNKKENFRRTLSVQLPYSRHFCLEYSNLCYNSAETNTLHLGVWRLKRDSWGQVEERSIIVEMRFKPVISTAEEVRWECGDTNLTTQQAPEFFIDLIVDSIEEAHNQANQKGLC